MGQPEQAGQQLAVGPGRRWPRTARSRGDGAPRPRPGRGRGSRDRWVTKSWDSAALLIAGRPSWTWHGGILLRGSPSGNLAVACFRFVSGRRERRECTGRRWRTRPDRRYQTGPVRRAGGCRSPGPAPVTDGESMPRGSRSVPAINWGQPTQTSRIPADEARPHSARVRQSMAVHRDLGPRASRRVQPGPRRPGDPGRPPRGTPCSPAGPRGARAGPGGRRRRSRLVWTSPLWCLASMTNTPAEANGDHGDDTVGEPGLRRSLRTMTPSPSGHLQRGPQSLRRSTRRRAPSGRPPGRWGRPGRRPGDVPRGRAPPHRRDLGRPKWLFLQRRTPVLARIPAQRLPGQARWLVAPGGEGPYVNCVATCAPLFPFGSPECKMDLRTLERPTAERTVPQRRLWKGESHACFGPS